MSTARRSAIALSAVTLATAALLTPSGPADAATPDCTVSRPTASSDFNGDGFGDLAIGDPGALVGTSAGAGAVQVRYGTAAGPALGATQRVAQGAGAAGAGDVSEPGDAFGTSLDWGLVDGDFCADLVVGVPGEDVGTAADGGLVEVIWGSESGVGLGARPPLRLRPGLAGISGVPEAGARLGTTVDVPNPDLNSQFPTGTAKPVAMGAPLRDVGSAANAGEVDVVLVTAAGAVTQPRRLTQATTGIAGNPEAGARFGSALAWSLLSSGTSPGWRADLLAGAPGSHAGAGAVIHLLERGANPFSSREWNQNTTGMGDASEPGDSFGASLDSLIDPFTGEVMVAVGAPTEDLGAVRDAGNVHVVQVVGSPFGTGVVDQVISQDSADVADVAEAGDHFGFTVEQRMMRTQNALTTRELLVGIPDEDVGSVANAGAVAGFSTYETLVGRTDSYITASFTGVPGAADPGARLGATVSTDGIGNGEVLIGVPDGAVWPTGAVVRLPNFTFFGAATTNGSLWLPTVSGGSRFGAALG